MSDGGPELRLDPLTREWVAIVGGRQDRPNRPADGCPFCVGGLEAPEPYLVKAFPNRWPPFAPGRGAAEIVLYSPDHDVSLASIGVEGARRVVDLWAERTDALLGAARDRVGARVREPGRGGRRDDPAPARADLRVPVRAAGAAARGRGRGRARLPAVRRGAARGGGGRTGRLRRRATGWRGCRTRRATRTACSLHPARTSTGLPDLDGDGARRARRRPRRRARGATTGSSPRRSPTCCGCTRACTCTSTSHRPCATPASPASSRRARPAAARSRTRSSPRPRPRGCGRPERYVASCIPRPLNPPSARPAHGHPGASAGTCAGSRRRRTRAGACPRPRSGTARCGRCRRAR